MRQTDHARRNQSQPKFRHDENILESRPVTHRPIVIPPESRDVKEYVTGYSLVFFPNAVLDNFF